jgi:hypothetical protein
VAVGPTATGGATGGDGEWRRRVGRTMKIGGSHNEDNRRTDDEDDGQTEGVTHSPYRVTGPISNWRVTSILKHMDG